VVATAAVAAGSVAATGNVFDFDAPAPGLSDSHDLAEFAFHQPAPKSAASPRPSDQLIQSARSPVVSPSSPTKLPAGAAPLALAPARANPLILGLVIAGSALFVGVGVALAVICLSAGGNESENLDRDDNPVAKASDDDAVPDRKPNAKNTPVVPEMNSVAKEPAPNPPTVRPMGEPPARVEPKPIIEKPVVPEAKPVEEKPQPAPEPKQQEKEAQPKKVLPKHIEPVPDGIDLHGAKKLGPYLVSAGTPKSLSDKVKKALGWLASKQHKDGGWGEGGVGPFGGFGGFRGGPAFGRGQPQANGVNEPSNVAETAIAAVALIRAGHTPKEGKYSKNILKAVDFICTQVEKGDADGLALTQPKNARPANPRINGGLGKPPFGGGGFINGFMPTTTVQRKIGQNVDTFLATLMLSEVKSHMPTLEGEERVGQALDKLIGKIQKNQAEDGSWAQQGNAWAPVLGQALATKAINRARQAGAEVKDEVLERAKKYAERSFDTQTNTFTVNAMAAGVALYSTSGTFASVQDSVNTFKALEKSVRSSAESASVPADRQLAMSQLDGFKKSKKKQAQASKVVLKNLGNSRFIQGFGSNGGEEFLSYMNFSEALAVRGGKDWTDWSKRMSVNLSRVQNADGSWSGHHCITGKTFCTAAALLSLMADRSPVPLAAKK
jgi:hypothetical protein